LEGNGRNDQRTNGPEHVGRLCGYGRALRGGGRRRNAAAGSYTGFEDAPKPRYRGSGDSPSHDRLPAHGDFSSLLGSRAGGKTGGVELRLGDTSGSRLRTVGL